MVKALRGGICDGASDHLPILYENKRWEAERARTRKRRTAKTKLYCTYAKEREEAHYQLQFRQLSFDLQKATAENAQLIYRKERETIVELWTTSQDKWPRGRARHWNRNLEELWKRKRRSYRLLVRNSDAEARKQHRRFDKLRKKVDARNKRIRALREAETQHAASLVDESIALQSDRRGRRRRLEAHGRKGKQVRPSDITSCVHVSNEQTSFPPMAAKSCTVNHDFEREVERSSRQVKRGRLWEGTAFIQKCCTSPLPECEVTDSMVEINRKAEDIS